MDNAEYHLPKDTGIWHIPQVRGHTLLAVLVRYNEEPYYFLDTRAF